MYVTYLVKLISLPLSNPSDPNLQFVDQSNISVKIFAVKKCNKQRTKFYTNK